MIYLLITFIILFTTSLVYIVLLAIDVIHYRKLEKQIDASERAYKETINKTYNVLY